MCITWPHICFTIHLLWCISYTIIGTVQIIIGVFFFASLPLLKLGSSIWVGMWNIIFGIGGAVFATIGKWTLSKQRTFLYVAVSVLIANVINLILLQIGEWYILLPENVRKLVDHGNLKMLVLYAHTITTMSSIVASVISFLDSQITFCSMQYHERYHHKKLLEKQDVLSDTEYVLPRIKSDSDENENASYFNKQYPQSWVYETHTTETSTVNSAQNRYSATSGDNIIDLKQTPSEVEFKDISNQNLNIEQPIVVVENTSDYTDRQLHYMASFSRTPSPIPGSDSSSEQSEHSGSAQESSQILNASGQVYRSRLNSAKSANAIIINKSLSNISPRPPSISAIDQIQNESPMIGLQETISNKGFKISADQIFIPLKDETVIRIKDEIFIQPALKTTPQEKSSSNIIKEKVNSISSPEPNSMLTPATKTEIKKETFSSNVDTEHLDPPEIVQVIPKEKICTQLSFNETEKKDTSLTEKPYTFISSVEQVVRLTSSKERLSSLPASTPCDTEDLSPKEKLHAFASCIKQKIISQEKIKYSKNISESSLNIELSPNDDLEAKQNAQETKKQYLYSSSAEILPSALTENLLSPKEEQNILTPSLERQMQIEGEDTSGYENHENQPYMFSSSQFDRQDTVISQKVTSPMLERQAPIERQDAISSPKEDHSFIINLHESSMFPSSLETDSGTTPENEEELHVSDEVESNNSNNISTNTIVNPKSSDDETDMPLNDTSVEHRRCSGICDTLALIENISQSEVENSTVGETLGNEIDNIFKIAEDSIRLEVHHQDDEELFNLDEEPGFDNLPLPEMDPLFVNVPPPAEIKEINGIDPNEWVESDDDDDDDSVDSSCMKRVPSYSTPSK